MLVPEHHDAALGEGRERAWPQGLVVDEGAVGAAEVRHRQLHALLLQARVAPGHRGHGQHDVAAVAGAAHHKGLALQADGPRLLDLLLQVRAVAVPHRLQHPPRHCAHRAPPSDRCPGSPAARRSPRREWLPAWSGAEEHDRASGLTRLPRGEQATADTGESLVMPPVALLRLQLAELQAWPPSEDTEAMGGRKRT